MKTITDVIDEFIYQITSKNDYDGSLDEYISQPLNSNKAVEVELIETEAKLGCTIPIELRNYYLNEANGTEEDEVDEYAIFEETLEIFSHQKIVNIYDYFKLYWERVQDENVEDILDDTGILSDDETVALIEKYKNEFFVCIVHWENNFIATFLFDKFGNYYRFYFDQDVMIDAIIKDFLNIDDSESNIKKGSSLAKLLQDYLEELKDEM